MDTNTNNGAGTMDIFSPFPGTELADIADIHGRIDALRTFRKVTKLGLQAAYQALDFAYALKGVNTYKGIRVSEGCPNCGNKSQDTLGRCAFCGGIVSTA